ncbi:GMC-type oxidoreductase acuG [Cladobotryum mycophilum]|uniref:GMC-type oxidoreductase acuG n=1 Tax=Cladobotryum mycophilum TaxID=491253 RepID=A0ABR0SBU0_9HYPO
MLWDYIFVGGGLSASVASNRLFTLDPSLKILVIEAGANANNDPSIVYPNSTNLIGGSYDWNYNTVPQVNLDNRKVNLPCGKGLGGGTIINSAGWVRGAKTDYDLWGETVNDARWSYEGLLPYMKMTEDVDTNDHSEHGTAGPMRIQSVISTNREYPLRDKVLSSWAQLGIKQLDGYDGNSGNPVGLGDLYENRKQGKRELASVVYPLDKITVLTQTMVAKVLVQKYRNASPRATGVRLANGTDIQGNEIILSAGAIRTPQLLMLSGIGPAEELNKHKIPVVLDSSDVGKNFVDHSMFVSNWKLRDPSAGYAVGSNNPLFQKPQYGWGIPADFIVTTSVQNKNGLAKAIEADEGRKPDPATHPLLKQDRAFNEHVFLYAGAADGSEITFTLINMLPTSRGSVTLASASIKDEPLIDPNYQATEVDKFIARDGLRLQIALAASNETVIGRTILAGETGKPSLSDPLTVDSTDDRIGKRIAAGMATTYHPMGTAAMGRVVDSNLRVKGVTGLRVVDTSVFPIVISGHLQIATYAMANQAAEIIYRQRGGQ